MRRIQTHNKQDTLKGGQTRNRLVNWFMRSYELGTMTVGSHDAEKLTEALGIQNERFEFVVDLAKDAWDHEETISESIEYLAEQAKKSREDASVIDITGSELVLAFVFFGRIWEDLHEDEE